MHILITGGTGYIGSHVAVDLIENGHRVTLMDNLVNSKALVVDRLEQITGTRPGLIEGDIRDPAALDRAFGTSSGSNSIDAVIHCAGLKAVGESVEIPLEYYAANVAGTIRLLEAMQNAGCERIVFSSSATVYGDPQFLPLTEDHPVSATNPYGRTKAQIEQILRDVADSSLLRVVSLRYFNPVGAHQSGIIGEDPSGTPNNLMPRVLEVATGKTEAITLFGRDWDTPDGTGVRDYIHVLDLARAHRLAIERADELGSYTDINIGTGTGYSVLELVQAVRAASGQPVPTIDQPRRPGDIATSLADPSRAADLLDWKADRGLDAMCIDAWRWRSANPDGY